jgi:IS5 family transposase
MDKSRENEAKIRRNRDKIWTKKYSKSQFGYKLNSIMDRDYELIRRLKKITSLLHNSQIVIRKNEVVYRYRGYFEAKQKIMIQQ